MDKNLKAYRSKQVVNWYKQLHGIIPIEKRVFEENKELLKRSNVLDIGIGGGRTTAYLLKICKSYVGIDYSESFVNSVKKTYPEATCFVMDARDLSAFKDASFDFVNFSFNGIDYVEEKGRKKILSEIKRILKPGGVFFFSTHNKNHRTFRANPWLNSDNSLFINVKTFIKLLPFFFRKTKQSKNEIINGDYAIINDSAHQYSLMTFYTTPAFLREQLMQEGFGEITFYGRSGEKKDDTELEDWIFSTTKKINA